VRNRRAFTLLELIVSLAVAGIVALLVYGSASAGFDTRDALARHRATAESELRARVMIGDALRHASDEADPGRHDAAAADQRVSADLPVRGAVFDLEDAMDARGLPADRLTFLTRGVLSPLGASALWVMSVIPSAEGLIVRAAPADSPANGGITGVVAAIRGLEVQTMSLADDAWTTTWPAANQLPAAVRLTFYDAAGGPVGAPMVVRVGLESAR
jgi:prepilin-type N-terminal cleavage/methylation domain-containing protein